jgi:hypothetical protein
VRCGSGRRLQFPDVQHGCFPRARDDNRAKVGRREKRIFAGAQQAEEQSVAARQLEPVAIVSDAEPFRDF